MLTFPFFVTKNKNSLDLRDKKTPGSDEGYESRKRRYSEQGRERARERFTGNERRVDERRSDYVGLGSGGGAAPNVGGGSMMRRRDEEEEDDEERRGGRNSRRSAGCKRFLQTFSVTFERSV